MERRFNAWPGKRNYCLCPVRFACNAQVAGKAARNNKGQTTVFFPAAEVLTQLIVEQLEAALTEYRNVEEALETKGDE